MPRSQISALVTILLAAAAARVFSFGTEGTGSAGSGKLVEIRILGTKEYTSEEVVRASGLEKGKIVTHDDCRAASRRLARSGGFSHVSYTLSTLGPNAIVTFALKDAETFLAIRYENFVWASDAELNAWLAARIPLFHGRVTRSEELLRSVETSLTDWLAARGVRGTVISRPHATAGGAKVDAQSFIVQGVAVKIREVEWLDAPNMSPAGRAEVASLLVGTDYESTAVRETAELAVHKTYEAQGRVRATIGAPRVRIASGGDALDVVLSIPVREGPVYRLGDIELKGVSAQEMQPLLHAKRGEVVNTSALLDDMTNVRQAVSGQGFFAVQVTPGYRYHDELGTLDYVITVEPGPLYHMGTLTIEGVPEASRARLAEKWKLKPGDVYLPHVLDEFLRDTFEPSLGKRVLSRTDRADGNIVNVTLHYE